MKPATDFKNDTQLEPINKKLPMLCNDRFLRLSHFYVHSVQTEGSRI